MPLVAQETGGRFEITGIMVVSGAWQKGMGFRGYAIQFGIVDYNGHAVCTESQGPLVKNRSESHDLVRRLPACISTVNTGGSLGIHHTSISWRAGLRDMGSWQYDFCRLRHASLFRICAVTPHPIHSVSLIPNRWHRHHHESYYYYHHCYRQHRHQPSHRWVVLHAQPTEGVSGDDQ